MIMESVWDVYPDEEGGASPDSDPPRPTDPQERRKRGRDGDGGGASSSRPDDDVSVGGNQRGSRARVKTAGEYGPIAIASTSSGLGNASDATDLDLAGDLPSDTLATVLLLRTSFPPNLPMCPLVIKSHIYSIVSDRTAVDRQLEELNRRNKVRIIKLSSDRADYGVVLWEDYSRAVDGCKEGRSGLEKGLLDWFLGTLVSQTTHCYVDDSRIDSELLAFLRRRGESRGEALKAAKESCVTFLVRCGLLTRRMSMHGGYWLSIPNIGIFVKSLRAGRKQLAGIVKRRRRCEILQWDLEKMKLPKKTTLGMKYHLRDAIGSGFFDQIETTCGPLLRAANKKEKL